MTLRDNPPPVLTLCFMFFVACLFACLLVCLCFCVFACLFGCLFVSFFVHVHLTRAIARCMCTYPNLLFRAFLC